jgi:hypothetical protein
MVYAFDATTGLPKTGDGANITAYVSKDYGTITVLADTTATEMDSTNGKGYYLFDAAQGETNADCLMVSGKSSTSNVVVIGAPAVIYTRPTTGWLAPATAGRTLVVDAAGLADANMVKMGPTGSGTAQTARDIGTSVLLSSGTGTGQLSLSSGLVTLAGVTHTGAVIPTVTTVTNQLTAAAIATGVWQDSTAGDFTTASSIGKCLYIANVVPGASGGHFIAGSNAATTVNITGTISTVTTVTNQLTTAQIATAVWTDTTAGDFTTASSIGKSIMNGVALGTGLTINGYTGNTVQTGDSYARIGAAGVGLTSVALASSTSDAVIAGAVWNAATATYGSAGSYGLLLETDLDATISSRLSTAGYTAPTNLTAAQIATGVWQDTTAGDFTTASSIGKSLYNAFTSNTSVFTTASLVNAPTGGSAPTAAQIATAVWQDTTAGDFTVASSIGKSLYTSGVVPGASGGLFIAGTNAATTVNTSFTTTFTGNLTGSVGSVTGLTASNLDTTVSSRMATYTQPTGFLAATFPTTVASTTNITAGTITTVTNLTNAPTAGDFTATMKTSIGTAVAASAVASVTAAVTVGTNNDKTGYRLSATGVDDVWDEVQSGHTTAGTFGKYLDAQVSTVGGGSAPTVSQIVAGVWDEAISGHLTAGTTGAKLNASAAAGDPLTSTVPGSYAGGTAGYALGQLGSGSITFTGPIIQTNNNFELIQGDDYLNADSRAFSWTFGATPNLTSATVVMRIQTLPVTEITGTKSGEGTSAQIVQFDMSRTITGGFDPGNYSYDIQATLSDASVVTLVSMAGMRVKTQVT